MKTALIYDWLVTMAGGEKSLAAIAEIYPSPIYTLVQDKKRLEAPFLNMDIHSSFLQNMPFAKKGYRYYLPFFPLAIEQFNLSDYDLIISTSHAVAKGALTHSGQLHICYCFTPMRYAWDLTHQYLDGLGSIQKGVARGALHYLRNWDITSLNRVDHFVAISHYIARRIKKVYNRDAEVIYPPVDTHLIPLVTQKENYFIIVSRMVPYKKIDLIVEAFAHLPEEKLVVIGEGPLMGSIKGKAGKNVEILGYQSNAKMHQLLGKAKGFLFAAEEDFGIVVVEALAAGTPVIAFGKGGALETVVDGQTGVFFPEQTVASIIEAVQRFLHQEFDPSVLCAHASRFSKERFKQEFKQLIDRKVEVFNENHYSCRR